MRVVLISCGDCGSRHLWEYQCRASECSECSTVMVLKTASESDLKPIKQKIAKNGARMAYSDYIIYKIFPDEIEKLKKEERAAKKQMMEEVKARKK